MLTSYMATVNIVRTTYHQVKMVVTVLPRYYAFCQCSGGPHMT